MCNNLNNVYLQWLLSSQSQNFRDRPELVGPNGKREKNVKKLVMKIVYIVTSGWCNNMIE